MITINPKKIVVPYDFSETAEFAIEQAAIIVSLTNGELILVFIEKKNEIIDILLPSINVLKPSEISESLSEKLAMAAERIKNEYCIKITPVFSTGNITNEIINISKEMNADMIVMGTQGNDSENDLYLGSNTYRTLTKSNLPILTLRTPPSKNGFSTILLPIDLTIHSKQKVNVGIQLAKLFNGHIHILGLFDESEQANEIILKNYIEEIEKECLKNTLEFTSLLSKTDNKVKQILLHSKNINADLIISMTDQNTEFESAVLGDYIHQLINNSTIPVLCIKPDLKEDNFVHMVNVIEYSDTI